MRVPIIIAGKNVPAVASDARAEADHEMLMAIHTLTAEVHTLAARQIAMLKILEAQTTHLDDGAAQQE